MEEKKVKMSLGTGLCIFIIVILLCVIIGMWYYFNNKKEEMALNYGKTEETVINEKNDSNKTGKKEELNNSDARRIVEDYLELYGASNSSSLLGWLESAGSLDKVEYKNLATNPILMVTNIKFDQYKKAMLNYVSEELFEKEFKREDIYSYIDSDGYLVKATGGGGGASYTITEISKISDLKYNAKATVYYTEADENEKISITFTLKTYNNRYVIDSINITKE